MKKDKIKIILMLLVFTVLISVLSLSGCKKSNEPQTLRIGVMSDVGAVPFIIAEEQGFFKARGLEVNIEVFKSALDRDTALQTGNIDGAMADMLTSIFFNDANFKVKMTSQTDGNYKMVTSPKLTIASMMELDPIEFGLSTNTVIDFATQKISESKNFANKLSKIAIPQMPVRLEMLKSGEINGATLPDPLASLAILEGGELVGSTADYDLFPGIVLISQETLENNSNEVKLMYEAYNEAIDFINQNDMNPYFDLFVNKLGFPSTLKDHFDMPVFSKASAPDMNTFNVTLKWMNAIGLSDSDYVYENLVDETLLPE